MWPDRVSNPGPLTYESGALPISQGSWFRYRTDNINEAFYENYDATFVVMATVYEKNSNDIFS